MIAPNIIKGQEGNPIRILHIEDSEQDHDLVRKSLSRAQVLFSAVRVETLSEFARQLSTTDYDIVLADYHLLGFTAIDAWNMIPVEFQGAFILVSGAIGESAAVAAIQTGMSDYVHKDDLIRLPHAIERSLELKRLSKEKAAADKDLLESKSRLAQFASHLQDTIESERAAIAREIHDDIGGSLAAVRLDLSWASRHIADPQVLARLDTANSMLQHALGASQRIMHNLRPAILDQGLLAAARWLAEDFERRTGVEVRCEFVHCQTQHAKEIELVAYRTVQEALTNSSKYAQASLVLLDISDVDGVLTVEISDNGVGIAKHDLKKSNAFGLRGLEERASAVGGWLDISTSTGNGTAVILTVPLTSF